MHRWSIRPSWTTSPAQPQAGKTNYCDREEPPSPHQGAVSALRSGPPRQAWQRARLAFWFYSPLRCPPPQMKEVSKSAPALTRLGESLLTCETHTWTAVDKECVCLHICSISGLRIADTHAHKVGGQMSRYLKPTPSVNTSDLQS